MKHQEEEKEANAERWTLTYLDMITLLFVLFVMLFAMSNVDAQKYQAMVEQFGAAFHAGGTEAGNGKGTGNMDGATGENSGVEKASSIAAGVVSTGSGVSSISDTSSESAGEQFDELYNVLKTSIDEQGYSGQISVVKSGKVITFRFKDSILFKADSDTMIGGATKALDIVANAMLKANALIDHVQVEGHTAEDNPDNPQNLYAWQLSSNRAMSVLRYFVSSKGLPQSKMSIAAYSHYKPVNSGTTEAAKTENRRVEISITRILDVGETEEVLNSAVTASSSTSISTVTSNASSVTSK